jgi:phosphate transport system substrate-binding protein
VSEVGYVPLPTRAYALALRNFETRHTGTAFAGGSQVGVAIEDLLAAEKVN